MSKSQEKLKKREKEIADIINQFNHNKISLISDWLNADHYSIYYRYSMIRNMMNNYTWDLAQRIESKG